MARIWFRRRDQQRSVLEEEQALQRERQVLAMAYRLTFATPNGQLVLADLLRRGKIAQRIDVGDPIRQAYDEGRRQLALEIIEMLNADAAQVNALVLTGDTEALFNPPKEE